MTYFCDKCGREVPTGRGCPSCDTMPVWIAAIVLLLCVIATMEWRLP